MRFRLVVGTVCLAAAIASAQDLKQQTGTGVVSGRVINAATGHPIPGAKVRLNTVNPPIGYHSIYRDLDAESDGTFRFTDVPAGTIELTADLDHYLEGRFGQRRPTGDGMWFPLAEGEKFGNADILLWPEARVTGHVSDEAGRPLRGVEVTAWRVGAPSWENSRVSKAGSAQTNAQGDYSIDGLSGGSYVIALHATKTTLRQRPRGASSGSSSWYPDSPESIVPMIGVSLGPLPRPPGTVYVELPRGFPRPPSIEGRPPQSYVSEFFPGGTVPDIDNPFTLSTGQAKSGVDFATRLVETTRVSGKLSGPHTTARADVMLRHPGFPSGYARSEGAEAATLTEDDWTFTLLDVPPGRYTLYERRFDSHGDGTSVVNGAWSDRPIEVTPRGINDLVIERPAVTTLRGRVMLHGKPADDFRTEFQVDVGVVPVDLAESDRHRESTEVGGVFEILGVVPGRYLVEVTDALNRDSWWVESVTLDGRNVTGQTIEVGSVEMARFVVSVTAVPMPLEGAVFGSDARVAATAAVVAFPVDRTRWSTVRSPTVSSTRAWKGRFKFDHLPAGEYYVTAMDDAKMEDWPSASFLDQIRGGATKIAVKAGQKQVVSLPLR